MAHLQAVVNRGFSNKHIVILSELVVVKGYIAVERRNFLLIVSILDGLIAWGHEVEREVFAEATLCDWSQ